MNKRELLDWIKSAKLVDTEIEYDNCGNKDVRCIYEKNSKLYSIEFCNHYYEPVEVTKVVTMVEYVNYVSVKEE